MILLLTLTLSLTPIVIVVVTTTTTTTTTTTSTMTTTTTMKMVKMMMNGINWNKSKKISSLDWGVIGPIALTPRTVEGLVSTLGRPNLYF
jgi:hypothetical protein